MTTRAMIGITSLALAGAACSSDDDTGPRLADACAMVAGPASREQSIDTCISGTLARLGMPGIQAAVVRDGSLAWSRSYGLAVNSPLPQLAMGDGTIFQLAAISAELLAVAFAQQVEAGALAFDADVNLSLPWPVRNPAYPEVPITWRMLLSHTSSLGFSVSAFDQITYGSDSPASYTGILEDVFSPSAAAPQPFGSSRPGASSQFSDVGLALVAYAVERASGTPFAEYARSRIIEPVGMQDTGYFLTELPSERLAVGVTCGNRCSLPQASALDALGQQHSRATYPTHLLRSSAVEYAKFMQMLLAGGSAGGEAVLGTARLDELLTPTGVLEENGNRQALAFFSLPGGDPARDQDVWGHTGSDIGVAASAFFDRSTGVGAVVLGNAQNEAMTYRTPMTVIVRKLLNEFR